MRIKYLGQMKDKSFNTRCAEISFDGDNEKEVELIDRIVDLMEKVTCWKLDGGGMFSDCCIIPLDDMEDYEEFKDWYKEVKRMFLNRMKHGF